MRVLFGEGIVKEVEEVEVKPLDLETARFPEQRLILLLPAEIILSIFTARMFRLKNRVQEL